MGITRWCRILDDGQARLGCLEGDTIRLYEGNLFDAPTPTDRLVDANMASWLPPVVPRQFLGLWNNFHERQQLEKTLSLIHI